MTIIEERLLGAGQARPRGRRAQPWEKACVMEAVAYVAGEEWSDHPECASTVISAFLRSWNDSLSDEDRQMLKPLIPKLVGTRRRRRTRRRAHGCARTGSRVSALPRSFVSPG